MSQIIFEGTIGWVLCQNSSIFATHTNTEADRGRWNFRFWFFFHRLFNEFSFLHASRMLCWCYIIFLFCDVDATAPCDLFEA